MKRYTFASIVIASALTASAVQTATAAVVAQHQVFEQQAVAQKTTCTRSFVREGQYFACEPQIIAQANTAKSVEKVACSKSFVREGQYFACEPQVIAQKATCKWPQEGNMAITPYIASLSEKIAGAVNLAASNHGSVLC